MFSGTSPCEVDGVEGEEQKLIISPNLNSLWICGSSP